MNFEDEPKLEPQEGGEFTEEELNEHEEHISEVQRELGKSPLVGLYLLGVEEKFKVEEGVPLEQHPDVLAYKRIYEIHRRIWAEQAKLKNKTQ